MSLGLFKNRMYIIYMYKEYLALSDLQWMICHKTKQLTMSFLQTLEKARILLFTHTHIYIYMACQA